MTPAEEARQAQDVQNEERFRLIVDSIPGFVCTLSAAGEVELLNRQLLEYFGKTTEDLKSWETSDAVHPDDLPASSTRGRARSKPGSRMISSFASGVPMAYTAGSTVARSRPEARKVGSPAGTCC